MRNLMSLGRTENKKQNEYLIDIRDVGMSIVFGEADADAFSLRFEKYLDYVEKPSEYLKTIKEVYNMIHQGECSPDDLLLKMGKHTKEIKYEEPELDICDVIDYLDDEDDIPELIDEHNVACLEIDEDTAQMLINILDKLSEE